MCCNNCGAKLTENAAFCEECGFPVRKDNGPTPTNKGVKKRSVKPIVITIIAAVLLIFNMGLNIKYYKVLASINFLKRNMNV